MRLGPDRAERLSARQSEVLRHLKKHRLEMTRIVPKRILPVTLILCLFGCTACAGESVQATQSGQAAPKECATYADCEPGMICQGASPNTRGVCVAPASSGELGHRMGYDAPGKGLLGTIYGQPIIRRRPPIGVPAEQAGGTWDLRTGTYYPPGGGGWRYQPGPDRGFNGKWIFDPALRNPSPGSDVVGEPAK